MPIERLLYEYSAFVLYGKIAPEFVPTIYFFDLNYTDPFYGSALNWWTSPELDSLVADIQGDCRIKKIVDQLKDKFQNFPEALSHGDLHTGSILVTDSDTKIIDTEFATYAPISFDIGMLLANFAMATLASEAHLSDRNYLAKTTCQTWDCFERNFRELWIHQDLSVSSKLNEIWKETLQLMGVEIIRRTIGVAHNADFEQIIDRKRKAAIEQKALCFAKELILQADEFVPNTKTLKHLLLNL